MALWMEAGAEPVTEKESTDLIAINALKESFAIELKENGNEYVKKGKKHYSDAIDSYTRAINQKALSDLETSIIFSNRAHVNLLLGNYKRALSDSEDAIRLSPTNVKALYRAVKASLFVNQLLKAQLYCEKGLEQDPNNEELKNLAKQIASRKAEDERREAEISKVLVEAKKLVSAIEERGIKTGMAQYKEVMGLRKPYLDRDNIIHWPVLLLYPQVMSTDFVEDFCETDMLSSHLDIMFSDSYLPLSWDKENVYTRNAIELYYERNAGNRASKTDLTKFLLEGTAASHLTIDDNDQDEAGFKPEAESGDKWVKVNEKRTLYDVLKVPDLIIPMIPVFYVVSKNSRFYKEFKSGNWDPHV